MKFTEDFQRIQNFEKPLPETKKTLDKTV